MMEKEKKIKKVENHLLTYGKITSWECITKYRYTRLSDAIYKLKKKGMNIETEMRYKDGERYAIYHLIEKGE